MFIGETFKIFDKASCCIIGIANGIVMDLHVWVPTHFKSFLPRQVVCNLHSEFKAN